VVFLAQEGWWSVKRNCDLAQHLCLFDFPRLACQQADTYGLRVVKKLPHSHILNRSIKPQHKAITANWKKEKKQTSLPVTQQQLGVGEEEIQLTKLSWFNVAAGNWDHAGFSPRPPSGMGRRMDKK